MITSCAAHLQSTSKSPPRVRESTRYIWIVSNRAAFLDQSPADAPPFGKAESTWELLAPELRPPPKARKPRSHRRVYSQRQNDAVPNNVKRNEKEKLTKKKDHASSPSLKLNTSLRLMPPIVRENRADGCTFTCYRHSVLIHGAALKPHTNPGCTYYITVWRTNLDRVVLSQKAHCHFALYTEATTFFFFKHLIK